MVIWVVVLRGGNMAPGGTGFQAAGEGLTKRMITAAGKDWCCLRTKEKSSICC